jgi:hypothetical protein
MIVSCGFSRSSRCSRSLFSASRSAFALRASSCSPSSWVSSARLWPACLLRGHGKKCEGKKLHARRRAVIIIEEHDIHRRRGDELDGVMRGGTLSRDGEAVLGHEQANELSRHNV